MTSTQLLRIACLTAISLPQLVAAQQGLVVSPSAMLALAVLNLFAGLCLSEMHSSGVVVTPTQPDPLTPDDVVKVSDEIERRLKKTKAKA